MFKTKNQKLDQAIHKIQELNKIVERTLEMERETRLISEIHTRELEKTIHRYMDTLAHEQLRTEESGRACIHLNFKLEQPNRRNQALNIQDHDATYMLLSNECRYWRNLYRDIEVTKVEDQRIIQDLQGLYVEWKGKFLRLSRFTNSIMQELPGKLQS